MKTVYVANKNTYGSGFYSICDSFEELKSSIVNHETMFEEEEVIYNEELYKKLSVGYKPYKVELHDDEEILFDEYDGQSCFTIVKKDPNILSKTYPLNKS